MSEVTSTNDEARRLAEAGAPEGSAVWADHQTRGRGRYGRSWISSAGSNVLMSIVLRPALPPERLGLVTLAGAVAAAEAVEDMTGIPARLKWPNDVLVRGRKVSGMLLEAAHQHGADALPGYVILGIGVNVNEQHFPPDLAGTATSLALEVGRPVSREALVQHLSEHLSARYGSLGDDGGASVREMFVRRLIGVGETVKLSSRGGGSPVKGRLAGIAEDGGLELELADGSRRVLHAGEFTTDFGTTTDRTR